MKKFIEKYENNGADRMFMNTYAHVMQRYR